MRSRLTIDKGKTAALFIDLQEEHRQDQRYLVEGFAGILANVQRLQAAARQNHVPLYHWAYIVDLDKQDVRMGGDEEPPESGGVGDHLVVRIHAEDPISRPADQRTSGLAAPPA